MKLKWGFLEMNEGFRDLSCSKMISARVSILGRRRGDDALFVKGVSAEPFERFGPGSFIFLLTEERARLPAVKGSLGGNGEKRVLLGGHERETVAKRQTGPCALAPALTVTPHSRGPPQPGKVNVNHTGNTTRKEAIGGKSLR